MEASWTGTTYTTGNLTTGEHTFGVEAIYDNGCTPVKVTTNLTIATCPSASNLAVSYDASCKALLSWNAPTKNRSEILWDNTYINLPGGGLISSYWSGNNNWVLTADDFIASDVWTIEKIYTKGFSNTPSVLPTKYAISIYSDNSGKPGTELFTNKAVPAIGEELTILTLPEAFTLPAAGKYWISIAGAYDATVTAAAQMDNYRWNILYGTTQLGYNYHLNDKSNMLGSGTAWIDVSEFLAGSYSIYFSIEGTMGGDPPVPPKYNIYKDGVKVASNLDNNSWLSGTSDEPGASHEWCVTVACTLGGESNAICKTASCGSVLPCKPVTGVSAVFNSSCSEALLSWAAPQGGGSGLKYTVKRGDVTICDKITATSCTDIFDFVNGTEYTWTITTICPSDESTPQEIKGTPNCVGMDELENNIRIYPNPATSSVTIEGENIVKVEIYNTVGQMVEVKTGNVTPVDVTSYSNGIYFFKIYDINNNVATKRIMITK